MAEPRRLAAALAPFHQVSKQLQATQARLSALLAAVTGGAAARTGNLDRLPGAALFNPFPLLPKVIEVANGTDAGARAGGRGADKGRRAAPAAAARPGANAKAAAAGLASATDNLRQAPGRAADLPPSAAARTAAAAASCETGRRTLADTARSGAAAAADAADADKSSACAPSVGELIDALLQRHAAPAACPETDRRPDRRPARTARSAAAAAAGAGASSAGVQSVGALINAVLQGHAAALPEAGHTLARAAQAGATAAAGAGKPAASAPSVGELIDTMLQGQAAPRPGVDTRPAAGTQPAANEAEASAPLQHASDTLRTLVAPLFLRPVADTGIGAAEAGAQPASGRTPLLRAPSRLLGAAAPGAQATASPAASAKAWATAPAPASDQPADGPADLAAGVDRLLREQAWLRGVDLT